MSQSQDLLFERDRDDIAVITLNRPAARNAVSFGMWEQFNAALDRLEDDSPARALVLCGAGGFFSAGGDMKTPPTRGEGALSLGKRLEIAQRVFGRLRALPMPTIAAVERGALGIAWGMTLCCDLVFAGRGAQFGAPFVNLGMMPDGGMAWQLTRQLGRRRAADLIFSGRMIGAEEAWNLDLVSHVVDDGTAVEAALACARMIGQGNRQAVELAKRMIHQAENSDLEASLMLELAYCQITQAGEELPRARAAFAARKKA